MYLSFDLGGKPDEATNFKSVIKIKMSRREVFLLITEIIKRRDCFKFKNNTPINQNAVIWRPVHYNKFM